MRSIILTVKEAPTRHLKISVEDIEASAASSSAAPTTEDSAPPIHTTAYLEPEWEGSLLAFPMRAITIGHATVQRKIAQKLRKLTILREKKDKAKMEIDSAPSSSTILSIIERVSKMPSEEQHRWPKGQKWPSPGPEKRWQNHQQQQYVLPALPC